jgi:UDP-N-acetylmuramate--alanine ligase
VHETGGRTVVDDYAHHPAEIAATIAAARERWPGATVRVLFQPHLFSRTRHLAWGLAGALAAADDVTVTDVYPAREQPLPGVTGKLVVEALSDRGVLAGWTPSVEEGAARLARRARDGDVLLVLGAGDVDRAVGLLGG